MNFQLSEEQQMLADSAKRFVRDNSDVETHRRNKKLMPLDAATWQQFADLGWLAVPFEEEHGGLGMGPLETMVLLEALGEGLIMAPYIATVVLGGGFLRQASAAQQAETIPPCWKASYRWPLPRKSMSGCLRWKTPPWSPT